MSVEIVKPGLLTTLQDHGRSGYVHLGIGRSGAFDAPALRIANALCGNPRESCGLEVTLIGPTLNFDTDAWIAVTGAPVTFTVDGKAYPMWGPVFVPRGAIVTLGPMSMGCRSYLAVHGGFAVEPVLGSRSTDLNAALGPFNGRALRAGDELQVGASTRRNPRKHFDWWLDAQPWFASGAETPLRLLSSSQQKALTEESVTQLFASRFAVQADSNRTGLRLGGPKLELREPVEMISAGCVPGLLQLPPSGQPIAFGPECPVSGGYPRLGQIAAVDIARLAQLRPGDVLGFAPCTLEAAWQTLQKREHALCELETRIAARLSA